MKVSVIIPTYNGLHRIVNILESLGRQTTTWLETIVVVDGSTDGTEDFLDRRNWSFPVKVVSQENKGRAAVRNMGAVKAAGELLIFFDDDMRLMPDCIAAHINHHASKTNTILTGAAVDDPVRATSDFQKYKCWLSRQWSASLKKLEGEPLPFSSLHLTAANMSISKSLFNQLGGFDESLRDCEDYDFAIRAYHAGVPVYYSEQAFGWHDDLPSAKSFIKRQLEYLHFNQVLLSKNKKQYAHLLSSRLKKPNGYKLLFFRFFKSAWWPAAVEKNRFAFLPKPFRYRLYTWIVTAHSTYKHY